MSKKEAFRITEERFLERKRAQEKKQKLLMAMAGKNEDKIKPLFSSGESVFTDQYAENYSAHLRKIRREVKALTNRAIKVRERVTAEAEEAALGSAEVESSVTNTAEKAEKSQSTEQHRTFTIPFDRAERAREYLICGGRKNKVGGRTRAVYGIDNSDNTLQMGNSENVVQSDSVSLSSSPNSGSQLDTGSGNTENNKLASAAALPKFSKTKNLIIDADSKTVSLKPPPPKPGQLDFTDEQVLISNFGPNHNLTPADAEWLALSESCYDTDSWFADDVLGDDLFENDSIGKNKNGKSTQQTEHSELLKQYELLKQRSLENNREKNAMQSKQSAVASMGGSTSTSATSGKSREFYDDVFDGVGNSSREKLDRTIQSAARPGKSDIRGGTSKKATEKEKQITYRDLMPDLSLNKRRKPR